MERQLPMVDLAGTPFFVDVLAEELRQKNNAKNRISFNLFEVHGSGYRALYDREMQCAVEDRGSITELGERYVWVTLPALMELDAEGIALKYGIPLQVLCPEKDNCDMAPDEAEGGDEDDFY